MRRCKLVTVGLLLAYLATGFYIVQGNEMGVVRRCGKLVALPAGGVDLRGSGLHYDLPWPFSQVDRVNLNEVRTLTVGVATGGPIDQGSEFLRSVDAADQSQFLTGDKNILNLKIDIQYRVSEAGVQEYLFGTDSPERRLRLLAEAVLTDFVTAAGVDYVHTLGRAELQDLLTQRTREMAEKQRLGLDVETVALDDVHPPIRVKAAFLDVNDARADKEKYIHAARAYAEQRREEARGDARRILDEAETYRQQIVEAARGAADSFTRVIEQLELEEREGVQTYAAARNLALRRRYMKDVEEILQKVAGKVFLDSGKSIDLTIFRDPNE